jgi:DNA-binding response OmpR family regulator
VGKRVLVVEDDQELGDLLVFVLASEGHDAVVARTVEQAILGASSSCRRSSPWMSRCGAAGRA